MPTWASFCCDRNRWTYWSTEAAVLTQHAVQWFYFGRSVVQAPQQKTHTYGVWSCSSDQPLVWIPLSPFGCRVCFPRSYSPLSGFIFSKKNLDLNQWAARHDCGLKEKNALIVTACSLELLLRAEVLQEKGKACAHQLGVRGQITSWQALTLQRGVNGVLMSELGQ